MSSRIATPPTTAGLPADNLLPKREKLPELGCASGHPLALRAVEESPLRQELKEWAGLHPYLDASRTHIAEAEPVLDLAGHQIHGRSPVHGGPLPRTPGP